MLWDFQNPRQLWRREGLGQPRLQCDHQNWVPTNRPCSRSGSKWGIGRCWMVPLSKDILLMLSGENEKDERARGRIQETGCQASVTGCQDLQFYSFSSMSSKVQALKCFDKHTKFQHLSAFDRSKRWSRRWTQENLFSASQMYKLDLKCYGSSRTDAPLSKHGLIPPYETRVGSHCYAAHQGGKAKGATAGRTWTLGALACSGGPCNCFQRFWV